MSVKLAERPGRSGSNAEEVDTPGPRDGRTAQSLPRTADPQPPLGVTVREMDRMFVGRLEIPASVQGVIVARVDPTGAARQVLRRGFVILEVNRRPTPTMADYQRIVGAARTGDALAIYYFDPTVGQRSLVTVVVD
jgi:S1-C subfamily serine protease